MIRDGIKTLAKQGACAEKSWPYNVSKFKSKPGPACYQEARQHQITSYRRILTLDQMRTCLAEGFPFVFGFSVYESFESQEVARTGMVNIPKPQSRCSVDMPFSPWATMIPDSVLLSEILGEPIGA